MTYDLVTLGETMLRLMPPGSLRLEQASQLEAQFGGSESNTAINLARLGKRTAWLSRLPENPLGRACAASIGRHGVDVSHVRWAANERMGVYFIEQGQRPRSIRVWYDRANSAASRMTPDQLPLNVIGDTRWLHLTGIFPALSPNCMDTAKAALDHASAQGVRTWFDVNYRALLWSPQDAAKALTPFCQQADYVILALRDAVSLWGAPNDADAAAQTLQGSWGGTVIITNGEHGASANDGEDAISVPAIPTTLVDRMGAGDAFASGVLCRLMENAPLEDAMRFGAAMAALKLTIVGDATLVTRDEVEAVLKNAGSGLQR